MKKSNSNKVSGLLVLFVALSILSCSEKKKNPVEEVQDLQQTSKDHALLDNEFNTIYNTVNDVANEDTAISGKRVETVLPLCASKTFDVATKTLTIDFGTSNCLCADGLKRRGKIISTFTGKYRTKGTKAEVTLDNYFVEDIQFKGTKIIENLGNASGNFKYSYTVTGAEAITPTGTITWNTVATVERTQGDSTFTPWDDIYQATGESNGVNRNGVGFTVTIEDTDPLVRVVSLDPLCWRNFVSGVLTMTDDNGNEYVLDYDPTNEGKCDKNASLAINGRSPVSIILR